MQYPITKCVWGLIARVRIQYGVLKRRECSPIPIEQGLSSAQTRVHSTCISRFLHWVLLSFSTIVISLCFAAPASATIAYVQGNTNGVNAGATVSTKYTSAQTAGDINIVVLSWFSLSPHAVTITDSSGNVYALAISNAVTPPNYSGGTTSVYYAKNITAASANANTVTVTLDGSESYVELSVTEYSGIDTVNPLDVAVGTSGVSTVANSGTIATTNANDLLFGNAYVADVASTAGSGYTKRFNTYFADGVEDKTVTSSGSYGATFTQTANDWWVMQMVAFKAAGGGQAPPDTTAPTAPTGLTAIATSSTQINLTWTASTDNVGVTGYRLERCSGASCSTFAQIASSTTVSYSDTGLNASTSYTYRVRATDAAGNLSGYSSTTAASTQAAGGSSPSPIAYIQGNTNGANPATTVSTTYTGAQTAGDTNIVVLSWLDTAPRVVSVTDTMGNVYTKAILTAAPSGSYEGTTAVYYAKNIDAAGANANTVTITLDSSESYVELSIAEYSGIDTVNPLDVVVSAMGTTGTVANSGTATTTNANDLLFGNAYVNGWASAAGSGYTKRMETWAGDGIEDETVTTVGSYSASMSQQSSGWWIMQMVAFRAAGSQSSSDTTAPSAPTALTATATSSTQINLTWTASTDNIGVTGYKIERCSGSSCSTFTQIASPTTTSYSDTGLSVSTSYRYRVRATDAAGNLSGYSSTVNATTQALPDTTAPSTPTGLTATATSSTQINLSWSASTDNVGVTGYKIERCSGASCSAFAQIATPATTSYSDTGLSASSSYSYRVRATDAAGNLSSYSNTGSATTQALPDTTAPSAPTGLTATATSSTQINLSWAASTDNVGVTGYRLERCAGASCSTFAQIASPTTTSYSDTGLNASTSYSYHVRATDAANNLSGYSNTASATTQAPPDTTAPTTPTGLTATTVSSTQINLSWNASTDNMGVTGYKVERCSGASCSTFAQIASPTTTSYSDTGLSASSSYSYRVRATDAASNLSSYSSTSSATTQPPPDTTAPSTPTGLTATVTSSTQINLSWAASTDNMGVTGYKVERCSGSSCSTFAQIASPTITSYSDTGLSASTNYSYRIRATDAAGNLSGYSTTASATTQAPPDTTAPTAPSGLIASATSGSQINVSWTASTDNVGVTGYKLERCSDASCSSFAQIATFATTSYINGGLNASTSYSYRVRATDAAGNLSGYSSIATATTQTPPGSPTGLVVTASSDNEVDLAWNAASGSQTIASYQVLRCQSAGCSNFSTVASVTTLTDYDASLSAGTSYSYEVVAVDSAGNVSAPSSTVTITTVSTANSCK